MRRLTRAAAALLPAVPLSLAALGITAGPASAAGCNALNCHGYDMNYFGCTYTSTTSAAAVDSRGTVLAYVWNRFSYACKSNWSEAQLTPAGYAAGDTIRVSTYTTDNRDPYQDMFYPTTEDNQGRLVEHPSGFYGGSASIYTDMVDGTYSTTSDVRVYHGTTQVAEGVTSQ